ncbi:MAG: right-handed parallel beta-helix repeat-containing protein [Actinobacteria bacterium]|nr:right-handed parallel beta-helix repeat-containing protein [Actinomycetota bacterium]
MTGARPALRIVAIVVALVAGSFGLVAPTPAAAHRPTIPVLGCALSGTRVQLTASARLDPSCTWAGVDITASGTTLDCQGATVRGELTSSQRGIEISSPVTTALAHVTVRNCRVEGFINSLRVTRPGFRELEPGEEFLHPTSDVVVEDSTFTGSRGVGVYVDGYVSGVTIRRNLIQGAGSSGIYLETGSKQSTVADNLIIDNGFRENGPGGQAFTFSGFRFWFWGVGREGISVDGSHDNLIVGNRFKGNANGGVFLYKNCGEYPDSGRYFERRDHATRNRIVANTFVGERNGVWVGSRMGENTLPMDCTDPAYATGPLLRVVLDRAEANVVRANLFLDVTYGVRVEDDDNVVADNVFSGRSPDRHAVVIGTPYRTEVLGRPVTGTVLTGNTSTIVGNAHPYRWVHGHGATAVARNRALGRPAGLCEGLPLPRQSMIFVLAAAPVGSDGTPPPTPDLTYPTVGVLPPPPADGCIGTR